MLQRLKEMNLDRILDNDEAVALSAFARGLEAEYVALGQDTPEWLEKQAMALREEIARRTREADLNRMKELERELDGYKTVGERRNEAQRKLAEVQRKLGMTPAKASR